ncbi:Kelch repeat-containing protein [Dyella nitratireducens]|uniref:Uncharacterized protein n=1 Tax=Dyella nitratireducens TaxID=1849580 RepID=A0ABQ1G8D0_9GAMM|nr:kelch repeat-containing protein [Dyella nitratireducens]GGA38718.1 hypothetical protein GCM10010981_29980 [Dyella nitratireducens]GLQ40355.1 hypothetical protein GCM10007902_02040 [Dyella nitratireducens]
MKRLLFFGVIVLGFIAARSFAQESPEAAGHLQPFGGYLAPLHGSTVSLLPDNSILVYGYGVSPNEWRTQQDQSDALRQRQGVDGGPDPSPKLYDPASGGWRRLSGAPECKFGNLFLHTATLLPNGEVLMAGGLCDAAKLLNDPSPSTPYAGLSLWDSATRQWQSVPALAQTRIFHTATLMRDGSVLLVGGESDPQLSQEKGEPVLASVELYAHGKLDAVPPMGTARAKHNAIALPDGSLLVTGGFDANGNPLASAELLNAQGTAWKTLQPMHIARYSHTATLLADGRVLVTGGIGQDGRPLRSVELWDPTTGNWSDAAELPVGLYGHAAARLSSGDVLVAGGAWIPTIQGQSLPWAWLWSPRSGDWQLAGRAAPANESDMSSPVSLAVRPDGSVLIFTPSHVLRWQPGPLPDDTVPAWQSAPAIAKLSHQRLMLVGYLADDFSGIPVARIWDATSHRWSDAGTLNPAKAGRAKALMLPSGDVIYVMVDTEHALQCQRWSASQNTWSLCGKANLQYLTTSPPQLGLLPDGRAFAIANMHEAAVYDDSNQWSTWRVDWHQDGLTYGAPVHASQPFATVTDPASNQRFEVNDAGARFLHDFDPARFTAMLWNARTGWWDYVLMGHGMGPDAQHLPDGCALSTYPIALYRAGDARVFPLSDPGFGSLEHNMTVMDDGTVVVVGAGNGTQEPGAGFFYRKASCAGFEPPPAGDRYVSPTTAMDPRPPPSAKQDDAKPSESPWLIAWRAATNFKWVMLVCAGLWLLYRLLRRVPWPRLTGVRAFSIRLLVYGALAIMLMPWILSLSAWIRDRPTSGWRQVSSTAQQAAREAMTPSLRPCRLIGLWSSTRQGITRRIELKDDGSYVMMPSQFDRWPANLIGHWKVQAHTITWQDDKSGIVDVNPIEDLREGHFQVIENDGTRTRFERIETRTSTGCDSN